MLAAAIGSAVAAAMVTSMSGLLPNDLVGSAISTALRAAPLALLQYLVLRSTAGFPPRAAGLWVAASLLAAALFAPVTVTWYEQGVSRVPVQLMTNGLMDVLMAGDHWVYALLFGFAQGLVLTSVLRRPIVTAVWVAGNLLAIGVAPYVGLVAAPTGLFGGPAALANRMLSAVEFWVVFAAITGLALVALFRLWGPPTAPAPAARLLPAPRL